MKDNTNTLWVVQSNKLAAHRAVTEKVLRLGAIERRLMGYLFAVAGKTPQEVREGANWTPVVRLSVADYENVFGCTEGHGYAQLKDAVRTLMGTVMHLEVNPGAKNETGVMFPLLTKGVYRRGEGWIEVALSEELKPFLHDLSRDFSRYRLETLGRLGSGYAIRLYEWCKSHEAQRACKASVEQFRAILGVEEGTHAEMRDLQKNVLLKAIAQVNKETELTVSAHPDRGGRGGKIKGWTFGIETKQSVSGKQLFSAEIVEHPKDVVPRKHLMDWWDWVRALLRPGCDKLPELPNWEAWDSAGVQFSFPRVDQVAKGLAPNLYAEWLRSARPPELPLS